MYLSKITYCKKQMSMVRYFWQGLCTFLWLRFGLAMWDGAPLYLLSHDIWVQQHHSRWATSPEPSTTSSVKHPATLICCCRSSTTMTGPPLEGKENWKRAHTYPLVQSNSPNFIVHPASSAWSFSFRWESLRWSWGGVLKGRASFSTCKTRRNVKQSSPAEKRERCYAEN